MGYPMTYQRVIHRNGLTEGDLSNLPLSWRWALNVDSPGLGTMEELRDSQWPHIAEAVHRYEHRIRCLLDDLRRLETDTVDEKSTCQHIAARTGVDPDVVAVVLKEFMAW